MSPAFVPSMKELAGHLTESEARSILDHAMQLPTTKQVLRFMAEQLAKISPKLEMLDMA